MKFKASLSVIMLALVISAGVAEATCIQGGKVSRLRTGSTIGNFVDIQNPGNLPSFATFYAVPLNDRFYSMLAAAQAGNLTVFVTGDAATCATAGLFRSGGNVLEVDVFRNQ